MSEIRQLPAQEERVESGPVQFGDDWPGLFLRGDNALAYSMALGMLLDGHDDIMTRSMVNSLLNDLRSCIKF